MQRFSTRSSDYLPSCYTNLKPFLPSLPPPPVGPRRQSGGSGGTSGPLPLGADRARGYHGANGAYSHRGAGSIQGIPAIPSYTGR